MWNIPLKFFTVVPTYAVLQVTHVLCWKTNIHLHALLLFVEETCVLLFETIVAQLHRRISTALY